MACPPSPEYPKVPIPANLVITFVVDGDNDVDVGDGDEVEVEVDDVVEVRVAVGDDV